MAHQLRVPFAVETPKWCTAALSEALPERLPVALKCGDTDLVVFRDSDGVARALLDQCAHRRAPLSLGLVTEAGLIQCPYHGWRYEGREGHCTAIPNLSRDEKVPRAYRVPAYAVVERDGFIHIWSQGDAEADAPVPDLRLAGLGLDHQDSTLLAYPHDALVDLLLDAPDSVLDINGLAIVNAHRFGDPLVRDGVIEVVYAAIPAARRGKGLTSEYPFRVALRVPRDGGIARVSVTDDRGQVLASAVIAFMSVKRTLCRATLRSTGAAAPAGRRPIAIGIRRTIDAVTACEAVDYVSRLRR